MSLTDSITFVVAANDPAVLQHNLLSSPCLRHTRHQILIQEDYPSAAMAYNAGMSRAVNELIVFVHQDIYLPEAWLAQLDAALRYLDHSDPEWGVVGCWGATRDGQYRGHVFSTGWGILGHSFTQPQAVQTLDEIVLVLKKSSGLTFDQHLPHFHFYGTDICMRAARCGRRSYAIPAFCVHNTSQLLRLPADFYRCYAHIRKAWWRDLPIQTTCIRVTQLNFDMYRRRAREYCNQWFPQAHPTPRAADPAHISQQLSFHKATKDEGYIPSSRS